MSDDTPVTLPPGWTIPSAPPAPPRAADPPAAAARPPAPRFSATRAASAPRHRPQPAAPARRGPGRTGHGFGLRALARRPRSWLIAYLLVLAAIAFWPVPVDSGAGRLLAAVTRVFPLLTYPRIEFGANILLFVPFGLLLAFMVRGRRHLVLPIAFLATVSIEAVQSVVLGARTASLLDVIANTAGACVGLLIAELVDLRRPTPPRT